MEPIIIKITYMASESSYLIESRKKICAEILSKGKLNEPDAIEFCISLHTVLEVSINSLFRDLILPEIKKAVNELEIRENLDDISFRDKVTLFVYTSKFNLDGAGNLVRRATEYHSIINELKRFAEIRNRLIHGHSVSSIFIPGEKPAHSRTRKALTEEGLKEQIKLYRHILEGLRFYIDRLDNLPKDTKKYSKENYLDDSFLPKELS
jgi:hypothetical protein